MWPAVMYPMPIKFSEPLLRRDIKSRSNRHAFAREPVEPGPAYYRQTRGKMCGFVDHDFMLRRIVRAQRIDQPLDSGAAPKFLPFERADSYCAGLPQNQHASRIMFTAVLYEIGGFIALHAKSGLDFEICDQTVES